MKFSKFFVFVGVLFAVSVVVYLTTTPRGTSIPLTGIVTGNDVIVSSQIAGRMIKLNVDEGSEVHKGDLIAEIDPAEWVTARDSAEANIHMLENKVISASGTRSMTDDQTSASIRQAEATLTSVRSQLAQAQANLWRDQTTYKRTQSLFDAGVAAAQDRDLALAAMQSSEAAVKSFEDQVRAAEAQVAVANANRKQLDVQQSDVAATRAQLQQARADKATADVRVSYTKVFAPMDGIVSVRAARQGEVLQVGEPIVTVLDVDRLWVQADVEETYIDRVGLNQKIKVQLPSGNVLEGTVIFKGVESDFATQRDVSRTKRDIKTFEIKVAVPNAGRTLMSGMTATVLLPPLPSDQSWWRKL
ncbi:MAG TPA: efflux RND transporter periplasmic adaptor subunit [Candidatus Acidoferrales bacterium]|jgi:multidrug resistance efflux pump|nr:efflux RND transporter periplasmic adaptor subunit [Candidatus Acidoferrales bacterium]